MPLVREPKNCAFRCVPGPPPAPGQRPDSITCKSTCNFGTPPPGYSPTSDLPPSIRELLEGVASTLAVAPATDNAPNNDTDNDKENTHMCGPDKTISPRTRAAHYSQPRNIMAPPKTAAPFSVAGLAPQTESLPLTVSAAGIPRAFRITSVNLAGVTADEIIVTVFVGGEEAETFTGEQLAPTTANPCIGAACGTVICAGSTEEITITITNITTAALGAADAVRLTGVLAFEGDASFVDCWAAAVRSCGLEPGSCGVGAGCGAVVP